MAFLADWRWQIGGARKMIPQQYLEPYGKPPTPQVHILITSTRTRGLGANTGGGVARGPLPLDLIILPFLAIFKYIN